MKLIYWKGEPNFGDRLNPWLWYKVFPGLFDDDKANLFLGIGTILWSGYPVEPIKHVFGSGCGRGPIPIIDEKWIFHCVRGPRTAKAFGIPQSKVITDPAILIRSYYEPFDSKKYKISLIPHWTNDRNRNYYKTLCEAEGIHYISPLNEDVTLVIDEIVETEIILAEAMHGAIVADALRVPWIPVDIHGVNYFKWRDWCESMGIEFNPVRFMSDFPYEYIKKIIRRLKPLDIVYFKFLVKRLVSSNQLYMSKDQILERKQDELWERVRKFRSQYC